MRNKILLLGNSAGDSEAILKLVAELLKNGHPADQLVVLATGTVAQAKLSGLAEQVTFLTLDDIIGPGAVAKYNNAALEDLDELMLHVWMEAQKIDTLYLGVPSQQDCQVHFQVADEFRRLKIARGTVSPRINVYLDYAFMEMRHAFAEAVKSNQKWLSVANMLFPFVMAKTLYCGLNAAIEGRAHVVGHLRVDESDPRAVPDPAVKDVLVQNQIDPDVMILFSGGKSLEADVATLRALMPLVAAKHGGLDIVIGLHPGVPDYGAYVETMQNLIEEYRLEDYVRIVAWPEKLKPDIHDKYLIKEKIGGDALERFATAGVVGSDPAQLLLKHVLKGGLAWTPSDKPTFVDGFMSGADKLKLFVDAEFRQGEPVSREALGIPDETMPKVSCGYLHR